MTYKDVEHAQPGQLLAEGLCPHNGEVMRYVAVRGGAMDWAVYVGKVIESVHTIMQTGQKVFPEARDFPVAATKDAIKLYRY